eukprot:scaffold8684_cov112-Isochrysis_galbana.AAC.6
MEHTATRARFRSAYQQTSCDRNLRSRLRLMGVHALTGPPGDSGKASLAPLGRSHSSVERTCVGRRK